MEPQSYEANNMNLPPVPTDGMVNVDPSSQNNPISAETIGLQAESLTTQTQTPVMPIPMPTAAMYGTPTPQNNPSGVSTTTTMALPAIADDGDLIEKEWVNKAKEIVEKTAENPHQQTKEITMLRADYMQKRYQKTVKLSE